MYNLHQFLQFNKKCPICQNPLTLYLQLLGSTCCKAAKISNKSNTEWYNFTQFKLKHENLENEHITLFANQDESEFRFSSNEMATEAKKCQMYFFYLCNENGIKDLHADYEINIYKSCYWRSTPILEFKKFEENTHWKLTAVNPDDEKFINADEVFSFKKNSDALEKVYILDLNYIDQATDFMYYTISAEQKNDDLYEPKIFDKRMPMIGTRPDFSLEHRDKLIDRFDAWILVS